MKRAAIFIGGILLVGVTVDHGLQGFTEAFVVRTPMSRTRNRASSQESNTLDKLKIPESSSSSLCVMSTAFKENDNRATSNQSPWPGMPSQLFVTLAQSQMELLAMSTTKIKTICLYLPQENPLSGQLEFKPAILYPHLERIFIANHADSGIAPSLPRTLTKLPGFNTATSLLPGYPSMYTSHALPGIGSVEEVMCDPVYKTSAVSVPLLRGSITVGVFLAWSHVGSRGWTRDDKNQIEKAAQSLSLALSMDAERQMLEAQSAELQNKLSDALHQVKSPLQAMRTYGKLLQLKIADGNFQDFQGGSPQLLELAKHLMVQSDRMTNLLLPMDSLLIHMPAVEKQQPFALDQYTSPPSSERHTALIPWKDQASADTYHFSMSNGKGSSTGTKSRSGVTTNSTIENFSRDDEFVFTGIDDFDGAEFLNAEEPMEFSREANSMAFEDFTHGLEFVDERQHIPPPSKPYTTSDNFFGDEELEMGFVLDILGPMIEAETLLASERGIKLEIEVADDLPGVWTRPKSLQEAVSNVLNNALKYVVLGNSDSPKVTVQFERLATVPGVVIRITDNGPGIRPDEQDAIFVRGYRGKEVGSLEGTGMGLDISRSMMSGMGGDLKLVENGNCGASFEFTLFRDNI